MSKPKAKTRRFRISWIFGLMVSVFLLLQAVLMMLPGLLPPTEPQGAINYARVLDVYEPTNQSQQTQMALMSILLAQGVPLILIWKLRRRLLILLYSPLLLISLALGLVILRGIDYAELEHLYSVPANSDTFHLTQYHRVTMIGWEAASEDWSVLLYRCEHDRDDCTVIETPYQNQPEASTNGVPFADLMLWHDQTPGYLNIVGGGVVLYSWKLDDLNAEIDALGR